MEFCHPTGSLLVSTIVFTRTLMFGACQQSVNDVTDIEIDSTHTP